MTVPAEGSAWSRGRKAIKRVIELFLLQAGPAHIARRSRTGKSLVLAYHNVIPDGADPGGDWALHLGRTDFARQLDLLTQQCTVVPLASLRSGAVPTDDAPRVALTFDDAYRGALTVGVEELANRALPATLFVPPESIGGRPFWWDALGGAERFLELRQWALTQLKGADRQVRAWAVSAGISVRPVPEYALPASEAELHAATSIPGIDLGSHSWSHPNLTTLDESELERELRRPLDWLRERFGAVVSWLSYPYGIASLRVERAAARAGYAGAVTLGGGWHRPNGVDRFRVPRLNVPVGLSLNGFALRLAGLAL